MNIVQIVLIATLYAIGKNRLWSGLLGTLTANPVCLGWAVGLVMGHVKEGAVLGALIQTIFLGVTYYGGAVPSDTRLATCIAVPLTIACGLDQSAAIGIAVPFGALGAALEPVVRTVNTTVWGPFVDRAIERLDFKNIYLGSSLYPFVVGWFLSAPIVIVILLLGQGAVNATVGSLPAWLTQGLSVMGGLLPALGFAMYIRVIGSVKTIPFFIIGFYLMKFFNLSILGVAIFAFGLAYTLLFVDKDLMDTE